MGTYVGCFHSMAELLQMTLWSLVSKTISYIKYPKLAQGGLDFSKNGKYMALVERRDSKDYKHNQNFRNEP